MPEEFKYDVFLSYSAKDKAVVRAVAERLRNDGLSVWFDDWEIQPGANISAKIEEGLEFSRVLVLCISTNTSGSNWAQFEAGTLRFRDPLNAERRFIPLRLDDAPVSGSLVHLLYIDWRATDQEQAYRNLLQACRRAEVRAPDTARPDQVQYTNAKVILVGDSGVGKTGLLRRLALDDWQASESTSGAWATQWKLPASSADGVEREIWLWDFGGQADQRLIHGLYMGDTALAVLVFDGQRDDQIGRASCRKRV